MAVAPVADLAAVRQRRREADHRARVAELTEILADLHETLELADRCRALIRAEAEWLGLTHADELIARHGGPVDDVADADALDDQAPVALRARWYAVCAAAGWEGVGDGPEWVACEGAYLARMLGQR
jgi:hypothetical protein